MIYVERRLLMCNSTILSRLESLDKKLYVKALEVQKAATTKLSRIIETFPNYTSHDATHSACLLEICEWLAPQIIEQLNASELFVLYSAIYLHDLGMAITSMERSAIENSSEYLEFSKNTILEPTETLAEWVRKDHHRRSAKIVRDTYEQPSGVAIRDKALAHAIALICESHGESDLENFSKYDPFFAYGTSSTTICLPLLGTLLRLSDLLHITDDRTPLTILPFIHLTTPKSEIEWQKHLSTFGIASQPDNTLGMTCICDDPNVHRGILRMCDYINNEFEYCCRILTRLESVGRPRYELACTKIIPKVHAEGYEPWLDLTFKIDREGIIRLVTGERIYHGSGAVVKELLMNAVDASRQAKAIGMNPSLISVEFNSADNYLSIDDMGIGMDRSDLEEFLLGVGRCIYQSDIYRQRYTSPQQIDALSEFGIGFASCFLIADHVVVETKKDGKDAYLIDLYDLLGFAAVRVSQRSCIGTKITLHLKPNVGKDIKQAVETIGTICPHVEIPIHVQIDNLKKQVIAQPFCRPNNELLAPFFRSRSTDFVVEYQHFKPEDDNMMGCMYFFCQDVDGIVLPGYSAWHRLTSSHKCCISQLGFTLPDSSKWPNSLLSQFGILAFNYNIDLHGEMRLDMDPSRTNVLPSLHNIQVIDMLDNHLVEFIYKLHQKHWAVLDRHNRFTAYRELGDMLFNRIMDSLTYKFIKSAIPLVDLLFDNMPLRTMSKTHDYCDLTWNEIRDLHMPVVFYQFTIYESDYEDQLASILEALPDVVIVIEKSNKSHVHVLLPYCIEKQILVSESSQCAYQVVEPWQGNANDLHSSYWERSKIRHQSFILPFVSLSPKTYAFIASIATRLSGGVKCWINILHPKISVFLESTTSRPYVVRKLPECINFIEFLHEYHGGIGDDDEYVEYIQQHQLRALNELANVSAIQRGDIPGLLLTTEDFCLWEGPR